MEQRIEDLLDGEAEDLDLDPVRVFHRIDGISMKRRELSCCCPLHQCFGHLAVIGWSLFSEQDSSRASLPASLERDKSP